MGRQQRVSASQRRVAALVATFLLVLVAACTGGDGDGSGGDPSEDDAHSHDHGHGHDHGSGAATGTFADERPASGGHLRLGVVDVVELDGFVPWAVAPDDHTGLVLADLLFESLLTLPAVGLDGSAVGAGPEPALATSVEPDADLMAWTVELGEGSFSDGSRVTAQDVAATLTAAVATAPEGALGRALAVVVGADDLAAGATTRLAGLEVVDDDTLVVSLVEPYAPLPELLASPLLGIVPEAVVGIEAGARVGPGPGARGPLGSGPYRVVTAGGPGEPVSLERSAAATGDATGPDEVTVLAYGSVEAALAAFEAGEVDWVPLPPSSATTGVDVTQGMVVTVPGPVVWWVGVDTAQPALSDLRARRGVVHAVDGDGLVLALGPGVLPLRSLVPPILPGGRSGACLPGCAHAPAEAERFLEAAGLADGGLTVSVGRGPGAAGDGFGSVIAAGVVDSLQAVGVHVAGEGRDVFPWRVVSVVPSPDGHLAVFASQSPGNEVRLRSEAVNGQLAVARATDDATERAEGYQLLEDFVIAEVVVAPVGQELVAQAVSSRVRGFAPRWDGTFVIDQIGVAGG